MAEVQKMHGLSMVRRSGARVTFLYNEAFMLMKYRHGETGRIEWVWNSRDGVTPFVIDYSDDGGMQHVDWHEDVFVPNFVPPIAMRIFIGAGDSPSLTTVDRASQAVFAAAAARDPFVSMA